MVALIGVLLVLLLAVRPLLKLLKRESGDAAGDKSGNDSGAAPLALEGRASHRPAIDGTIIERQIELAQRMVEEKPEQAVVALRRMLAQPGTAA